MLQHLSVIHPPSGVVSAPLSHPTSIIFTSCIAVLPYHPAHQQACAVPFGPPRPPPILQSGCQPPPPRFHCEVPAGHTPLSSCRPPLSGNLPICRHCCAPLFAPHCAVPDGPPRPTVQFLPAPLSPHCAVPAGPPRPTVQSLPAPLSPTAQSLSAP